MCAIFNDSQKLIESTTVHKYNVQIDNQNHMTKVDSIFPMFAKTILSQLPRTCFSVIVLGDLREAFIKKKV